MRIWIAFLLVCASLCGKMHAVDYSTINLYEFDYVYEISEVRERGMIIELSDGSVWCVAEMSPETTEFYDQLDSDFSFRFVENVVSSWSSGDVIVMYRFSDSEPLIMFNADREQLFDVTPFLPPIESPLAIKSINAEFNSVTLTDGSVWHYDRFAADQDWEAGDSIVVARNAPWIADYTHVLINVCACRCDATVEHIHPNRLSVIPIK